MVDVEDNDRREPQATLSLKRICVVIVLSGDLKCLLSGRGRMFVRKPLFKDNYLELILVPGGVVSDNRLVQVCW